MTTVDEERWLDNLQRRMNGPVATSQAEVLHSGNLPDNGRTTARPVKVECNGVCGRHFISETCPRHGSAQAAATS